MPGSIARCGRFRPVQPSTAEQNLSRPRSALLTLLMVIWYSLGMPSQVTVTPGAVPRNSARPPTGSRNLAPPPGVTVVPADSIRPTAKRRTEIRPIVWNATSTGFPSHHPYVRKFWTAAIGPGAVADLMRLAVAARRGRSLPLPTNLPILSREGLVSWSRGQLLTGTSFPPVPHRHLRQMAPALRREHRRALVDLPTTS
jgi:hypothetical protein